jgi:primosomal protein N''
MRPEGAAGRELTLANIRQVLNTGREGRVDRRASSPLGAVDLEALLAKAVAGMDAALEKAVQANRKALQQMVDQGADLRETQVKKALADIEKLEDTLFAACARRPRARRARSRVRGPAC